MTSGSDECRQIGVERVAVGDGETMIRAWIDLQRRILNELGRDVGGCADRDDLVVVAMDEKRRNVDLL